MFVLNAYSFERVQSYGLMFGIILQSNKKEKKKKVVVDFSIDLAFLNVRVVDGFLKRLNSILD